MKVTYLIQTKKPEKNSTLVSLFTAIYLDRNFKKIHLI